MTDELRRLADEPVPAAELEKARNYTKGRFAFSIETPQGIIGHGLRGEILHGRRREPAEVLAALDAVTADDLQRVARRPAGRRVLPLAHRAVRRPERFERLVA